MMMLIMLMMLTILMMLIKPTRARMKDICKRMQIRVRLLVTMMVVVTRTMMTEPMYRALPHPAKCVIIGCTMRTKRSGENSGRQAQ
jgi:F0F1-type ATP synthase membrane subunit a